MEKKAGSSAAACARMASDSVAKWQSSVSILWPGQHPIIPVMLGDATLATRVANALLEEGIYVIGFSYPVVPKGKARIRTQMSAAHTEAQIGKAVAAFGKVGRALGAIR